MDEELVGAITEVALALRDIANAIDRLGNNDFPLIIKVEK